MVLLCLLLSASLLGTSFAQLYVAETNQDTNYLVELEEGFGLDAEPAEVPLPEKSLVPEDVEPVEAPLPEKSLVPEGLEADLDDLLAEETYVDEEEAGSDYSLNSPAAAAAGGSAYADGQDCKTIGGPGKGKACIFPFTWVKTGKTYHECTTDGGAEFWCSTKLNKRGQHLSGNWGECPPSCLNSQARSLLKGDGVRKQCSGKDASCMFPLTIGGYSYNGCIKDSSGDYKYGFCVGAGQNGSAIQTGCTKDCPRDLALTDSDLPIETILAALLKKPLVSTFVDRKWASKQKGGACLGLLKKKFKKRNAKLMPKEVRKAKSWAEAHRLACEKSSYCSGSTSPACQSRQIVYRQTRKKKRKDRYEAKADCKISCGFPDDPSSDYNNFVH